VVSIDLTPEAIRKAKQLGYRLIVNHHPCIFPRSRGLGRVTPGGGVAGLVFEALREGIAVIASHTNFDQCALEVVHSVAGALGIHPQGRLVEDGEDALLKLVAFVPETHLGAVRAAVTRAGAGHIGQYDACTFAARGEGTFRGSADTRPFLGEPGKLESVAEARLETVLPAGLRRPVLRALREAHPYEEVAYDLYPVSQAPGPGGLVRGLGYGFWGDLPRARRFSDLARDVKDLFRIDGFRLTDPGPRSVRRVAFVAGKGISFLRAAAAVNCELLITGEAGYHESLDGLRRDIAVLELGHRESERFFPLTVRQWLRDAGLPSAIVDIPTQRIHR
jgi:hypothetical protein